VAIGDPSKNGVRTFFSHLRLNLSLLRKLGGKKLAVFSFLGGFALALIIFGTAGLISWDKFSQIAFSDVDPQIAEELSRKIVYTGENFGKKEYSIWFLSITHKNIPCMRVPKVSELHPAHGF